MRKLLSLAAATALIAGMSLTAVGTAQADQAGDAVAAGVFGGVLGFMAGSAAAHAGPVYHHHQRYDDWEQHVNDCEDAYGWRYDPDTDLVTRHGHSFYCDM
jgi:hypothetical protein